MKKTYALCLFMMFLTIAFSQNINPKLVENAKKTSDLLNDKNIWILDQILGYTGLGANDWEYDQFQEILERNSNGLPTVIEMSEKIEGTQTWVNVYRSEFSYYENDTVYEFKVKEWNTQSNSWNTELSYYEKKQEDGDLIETFLRFWDNDGQYFYAGDKRLYYYDSENKIDYILSQDWDDGWDDYLKYIYSYDGNGNNIEILEQILIGSGTWRDNWRTINTFNEQNQLTHSQQWGYDSYWDEWYDYNQVDYSYYENGQLEEEFSQFYDYDASEWYDAQRIDYHYTTEGLLSYKEEYDLENLDNSLKYEYVYNSNLDEINFFLYSYNGNDDWTMFYRVYDEYDENNNQTSFYSQTLDGTWKNMIKEEYIWISFVDVDEVFDETKILVYPNPARDYFYITSENFISAKIYNQKGQLVLNSFKKQLDVSDLEGGLYILKINTSEGIFSKKIIVE